MSTVSNVIDKVMREIGDLRKDVVEVKKSISLGGDQHERDLSIVKALRASGNGSFAMVGGDGASLDAASIMHSSTTALSMGRQKSLFGGKNLQAIAIAKGLVTPQECGWREGCVQKHLEANRFGAIEKGGLAEASGITGGFTVAPQYYMNMIRAMVEKAQIRTRCTTIPMQSRTIQIPALKQDFNPVAGQSAYLGGLLVYWQPESATISQTQPNFRQIEMVARDMVFITLSSNQLLQDNAVSLDSFLSTLFQEAMTWSYDYFILRGNGANQPMGLIGNPAAYNYSRASAGAFGMADAAGMYARLLMQSVDSSCWIMHPSVMPSLITMTNGATNSPFLTFLNPAPNSGVGGPMAQAMPFGYFMGLPLILTEKLPALSSGSIGSVILADLSKQLVGDRLAIQIESSNLPYFTSNQTVWRVVARWDSQNSLNSPIVTEPGGTYQMADIVVFNA